MNFTKGQQIKIDKTFTISIGTFDIEEVAIISNINGKFTPLKQIKISKRLKRVKRFLGLWLNNDTTFNFGRMPSKRINQLINIMRGV